jgi:predicted kinase
MVLAVFTGLPGVGKSTLARQVGAALPATVLATDTVHEAMRRDDVTVAEPLPGHAAYQVVAALAEAQLRLGLSVVIDAINPRMAVRRLWSDLAEDLGVPLRIVEVVCGDAAEHQRRVEERAAGEWSEALRLSGEYEPYIGPRLVVDTSVAKEPVKAILDYLN